MLRDMIAIQSNVLTTNQSVSPKSRSLYPLFAIRIRGVFRYQKLGKFQKTLEPAFLSLALSTGHTATSLHASTQQGAQITGVVFEKSQ